MQPLVSPEFAALVRRCSCAPCAALRSSLGAPVLKLTRGDASQARLQSVTDAEKHLLGLVSHGLSNRQIGERLGQAEHTIKHRTHVLFRKMGVKDRTTAALRAHELGLTQQHAEGEPVAVPSSSDAMVLLTDDERRTLGLVGKGLSNKEIGRALNLAESTVKNRLSRIFGKLGAHDRTQAALMAVRLGLVRIAPDQAPKRRGLQKTA